MSTELDTSIPLKQQNDINLQPQPQQIFVQQSPQPQQIYVQQSPQPQTQQIYVQQSPQPQQVYVQQSPQPQQVYVQQIPQSNQMQLSQIQDKRTSINTKPQTQELKAIYVPQQQYNQVNLGANPQQPTIQIPQQNNLMFQNQINQMPLIGQEQQQVTIEESLTFSIKWNCAVIIKFLVDLFIFSTLLSYQYGLIDFILKYSLIVIVYEEILQCFHIIMCAVFIWANLGCGYSYKNSITFKRFHYVMFGLSVYETIKFFIMIGCDFEYQKYEYLFEYYYRGLFTLIVWQKIIATILLGISICYKK